MRCARWRWAVRRSRSIPHCGRACSGSRACCSCLFRWRCGATGESVSETQVVTDLFDRAEWALAPDVLHLNHGSFGAVTNEVRAAQDRWRDVIDANPTGFISRRLGEEFDAVRGAAAGFLHTDPHGLVLVSNVTWAAAMVL